MSELNYKEFSRFADGISWKHKNGTYLVFVQVKDEYLNHTNNRQASGLNHIAFQGASEAQLDHIQTLVISLGGKILKRAEAYLCFEDPNLFAVEVYAP